MIYVLMLVIAGIIIFGFCYKFASAKDSAENKGSRINKTGEKNNIEKQENMQTEQDESQENEQETGEENEQSTEKENEQKTENKQNAENSQNAENEQSTENEQDETEQGESKDYIKWVDFNVSYDALCKAYEWDVQTYGNAEGSVHVNWIEVLAYVAAKSGGNFGDNEVKQIAEVSEKISKGEATIEELKQDLKYYDYYYEAYSAVLSGFVGEYTILKPDPVIADKIVEKQNYGLKAFSPIAKGFSYSDYDDFGVARTFGYKRQHLGHDMMGQIGTPIVAVESGYVEALGWNKYGGWRIGIRSFDKKRYYYYAHLRQNFPFCKALQEGSVVKAGDVIGYMGHTGYSDEENVNNIDEVHLHFGIQLIFDESQKECNSEIWINPYNIVRFLYKNRSLAQKNEETKEWVRVEDIILPEVEAYEGS